MRTFSQRSHPNSQQLHGNVLKITTHQGNANQKKKLLWCCFLGEESTLGMFSLLPFSKQIYIVLKVFSSFPLFHKLSFRLDCLPAQYSSGFDLESWELCSNFQCLHSLFSPNGGLSVYYWLHWEARLLPCPLE